MLYTGNTINKLFAYVEFLKSLKIHTDKEDFKKNFKYFTKYY